MHTKNRKPLAKLHSRLFFCIFFVNSHSHCDIPLLFYDQLKTIRALPGQTCNVRKAQDDEVQMKLLAGETQYEHSALSTCLGLECVHACLSLAVWQTSAAKVKFQSVWNQSIEPAAETPACNYLLRGDTQTHSCIQLKACIHKVVLLQCTRYTYK